MIKVDKLIKKYGSQTILDIDELNIKRGIHLLQGANGTGKSTFMQCLSGIISYEGEITIGDTVMSKSPVEYRKLISYSEAEPQFPIFLKGSDLLNFVSRTKNVEYEAAAGDLEILQMNDFIDRPIATYSSGMLKKLSLAITFTGKQKWILLDEPFTTIDRQTMKNLVEHIKAVKSQDVSFIISTHQYEKNFPLQFDEVYNIKNRCLIKA